MQGVHLASEYTTVPVYKRAARVEFRRGADMRKLALQVLSHPSCEVDAAVGSGKSVLLPKELALAAKKLVLHVFPNRLLALDVYRYVEKQASEAADLYPPLVFVENEDVEFPRQGVAFIGAADLVGRMLRLGASVLKNTVVYLDEAHESDAYTYSVRMLARVSGASALVMASATFGPSNFRVRETLGSVDMATYPADQTPETWNVSGGGRPWKIGEISNNLLIFTDSRTQMALLRELYADSGFSVHTLTANMQEDDFSMAMKAMRDKTGPLVVVLADYAFRSGFTFEVGTIIDTARVSYFDADGGRVRKLSRPLFMLEREQAAGRGGRISGLRTKYYMPEVECLPCICELEGTEKEAAALIWRYLGFKPSGILADAVMASAYPDVELRTGLNGPIPLVLYPRVTRGKDIPTIQGGSEGGFTDDSSVPTTLPSLSSSADVEFVGKMSSLGLAEEDVDSDSVSEVSSWAESLDLTSGAWDTLMGVLSSQTRTGQSCVLGEFYLAGQVRSGRSMAFPRGLPSVMSAVDEAGSGFFPSGVSSSDTRYAVGLLVDRNNVLTAELMALRQAVRDTVGSMASVVADSFATSYFARIMERAHAYETETVCVLRGLNLFAPGGVQIAEAPEDLIRSRAVQYSDDVNRVVADAKARLDGVGSRRVNTRLAEMPERLSVESGDGSLALDEPRSRRASGGKVSVAMPWWTGFKSVEYRATSSGGTKAVVKPGAVLRGVFGRDQIKLRDVHLR